MSVPAPKRNSSAMTMAAGLENSARASRGTRRGSVVMGKVVAPPEMMKMAITETYVIAHSRQNVCSCVYDAQAR
jgi:hypothetical protein